jgi:hypothetical protein
MKTDARASSTGATCAPTGSASKCLRKVIQSRGPRPKHAPEHIAADAYRRRDNRANGERFRRSGAPPIELSDQLAELIANGLDLRLEMLGSLICRFARSGLCLRDVLRDIARRVILVGHVHAALSFANLTS